MRANQEPAEDGAGRSSLRQPAPEATQDQAEDSAPPVPNAAGGDASPAVDDLAEGEATMVQRAPNPGTTGQVTHAAEEPSAEGGHGRSLAGLTLGCIGIAA